jgi:hypothetical protein
MNRLVLALVAIAPLGGCVVTDGDVAGGAVDSLTAAPAADAVNTFTVGVSGTAAVHYTSPEPGLLDISVDGATVIERSVDLSTSLTADLDADVPLSEGPNEVVVTFTYQGEVLTQGFVVNAGMDPTAITLPTWTPTYTAHQGLDVTGTISVGADAAYVVSSVGISVDGGPWMPATDAGAGAWDVTIVDPDIGDSDIAVRATATVDGHSADTVMHGRLTVDPVFDCADAASMLPVTQLIRNNGTEQRVMAGYFGRADGGHDVTFVLDASVTDPINADVTVVSSTTAYATTEVHASWTVSALRCDTGTNTCSIPYDLSAYVDGVQICSHAGFGNVVNLR